MRHGIGLRERGNYRKLASIGTIIRLLPDTESHSEKDDAERIVSVNPISASQVHSYAEITSGDCKFAVIETAIPDIGGKSEVAVGRSETCPTVGLCVGELPLVPNVSNCKYVIPGW